MSGIDPKLIAWLAGSGPAQDTQDARRRLAALERQAGIAAQNVREDLEDQINDVAEDLAALQFTNGIGSCFFNGSPQSDTDTIAHGLGANPGSVAIVPIGAGYVTATYTTSTNNLHVTLYASTGLATTGTVQFAWTAFA